MISKMPGRGPDLATMEYMVWTGFDAVPAEGKRTMTEHVNAQSGATTPTDAPAVSLPERKRRGGDQRSGRDRRHWNLGAPDGMAGERRSVDVEQRQQGPRPWNLGAPRDMFGERRRDIERRQQAPAVGGERSGVKRPVTASKRSEPVLLSPDRHRAERRSWP